MVGRARWIIPGIALIATTVWFALGDSESPSSATPQLRDAADPIQLNADHGPASESGTKPVVTASENPSIAFETVLLADQQISAQSNSVRLGLAYVSPDEALTWQKWKNGGAEGAGPAHFAELANVERWIELPAERRADGSVHVGPIQLPQADRYDLQASSASPLHFYLASFTPEAYPAAVSATVAAGLRVLRDEASDSDVRVLLRRSGEIDQGAPWQDLMARVAPQLLDACNESAIAVETSTVLAPLPPGAITVILEVDGVEAERQSAILSAGSITDLRFDPVKQAVAHALAVELQLSFVVEGTRRPIADIEITWTGGKIDQTQISDASGSVRFKGMDRQQTQRFSLQLPHSEDELPIWPMQKAIEVTPDAEPNIDPEHRLVHKTIELRPLQWLIVRSGALQIPQTRKRNQPYPIFVLQREQGGAWSDTPADQFIPVAEGIAASLEAPGRYRLVALQAPWSLWYSTPAQASTTSADGKYFVDLVPASGRPIEIMLQTNGLPLSRAPVALRGPIRGLPASTLDTDADGRIQLNGVTEASLELEVPGFKVIALDLRSASVVVQLTADAEPAP